MRAVNTDNVRSVNIVVWNFGNEWQVNCTTAKSTMSVPIITETNGAIMRGLDKQIVDSCVTA